MVWKRWVLAVSVGLVGCAVNPATGSRQLSLISESREIEMGREADPQIVASMGVVENRALNSYVEALGKGLAAGSERPALPWSFRVVDDPVVNAFALPGGYIYVTRGILAHLESEAELAGVLGHEIGHVTARHSVNQMSRQQIQQVALGVGSILSEDVRGVSGLLQGGLQLVNLRYSRGDESQSDELGFRYMTAAGYDAAGLVGVFQTLAAVSGGEGDRAPQWSLTHPYPENRETHIQELLAAAPTRGERVGSEAYMSAIDGIVYGADPREGFFQDRRFVHPDLEFQMDFPAGWKGVNQKAMVGAVSPREDALVALTVPDGVSNPRAGLDAFLGGEGIEAGRVREGSRGGLSWARAVFVATTDNGELNGEVAFWSHGGTVFRILGYTAADHWSEYDDGIADALGSFAVMTDPAVLGVEPWRLSVVSLPARMTLEEFHRRYPSVVGVEEIGLINRWKAGEARAAGTRVKRVVGKPLP